MQNKPEALLNVNRDKTQDKEINKERKIKPLKQPVKSIRPARRLEGTRLDFKVTQDQKQAVDKPEQSTVTEHKISSRQNICTDLLENGNVNAFIDFFYTALKCIPNVMEQRNYVGLPAHIPELADESEESLQFLSEFARGLGRIQVTATSSLAHREAAMNEYNSIAFNYEDRGDFVSAAYFYRRVIDIAIAAKNKKYELIAFLGLAKCYDQSQNQEEAINLLQQSFDATVNVENNEQRQELVKLIGKELIEIYIKKAEQCLKFDLDQALEAYKNSLNIAVKAREAQSQARISYKIGELYYEEGLYEKSVGYQIEYLAKLAEIVSHYERETDENGQKRENKGFKIKQMEANASLAKCYLKMKDIEKAQIHLNEYHRMAKEAKAQNSVADSSYYLAKLFEQKGEREKSIVYYQSYFEAAKSEKQEKKDRKLIDKARVAYAIAKSNRDMERYISLFMGPEPAANMKAILDWKLKHILK